MSDPNNCDQRTAKELAAARVDMTSAIAEHIEWLLDAYAGTSSPMSVAAASENARSLPPMPPEDKDPHQIDWHTLGNLVEYEPTRAAALWRSMKDGARTELDTGTRAARALERRYYGQGRPYDRAQYLVILEALTESLQPQGGVELLLVQQMATAYEEMLRWQKRLTQRTEEEQWAADRDRELAIQNMRAYQRDRFGSEDGWRAPRVSDVQAIEQAVMIADRYQRAFVRLLRSYRDQRRIMGSVVMMGGQLNVAERQIVAAPPDPIDG
jgi:hypothetical protein